jgi:phosphohistidine phosphatase SixA
MFRSEQLADWFQDKDIREIWSSDYRRSRETAEPLLSRLGLKLTLYDPRDLPALARDLLDKRNNALVVGHSNTTPELARLLCGCVISDMDESEYDRLIVVTVTDGKKQIETLIQNTLLLP